MLRKDNVRRSDSPWASPLHLVSKKEDGWRPFGDYRALNARTNLGRYPVRRFADFAQQISGRRIVSTTDLVKAYHRIPVHPDNMAKTSIVRPFSFLNSRICPSVSETPCKRFSGSWVRFSDI
jgi:hypothetical protein